MKSSDTSKVKIAIIGSGWWGTTAHLPAILDNPLAQLVGLQHHLQPTLDVIRKDLEKKSIDTSDIVFSTKEEDILKIPGLSAVVISSIPVLHYSQAKAALSQGLHVVLEKPMVVDLKQSEELVQIAKDNHCHFILSTPSNFTGNTLALTDLVASGKLGKVLSLKIEMSNYTLGLYQGKSWAEVNKNLKGLLGVPLVKPATDSYSDSEKAAGGQLYCQTSHVFAYISKLFNHDDLTVTPSVISAKLTKHESTDVDVANRILLTLSNGCDVDIYTHGDAHPDADDKVFTIHGECDNGSFDHELWQGTLEVRIDGELRQLPSDKDVYPAMAPTHNLIELAGGATASNISPAYHGLFGMLCTDQCLRLQPEKTKRPKHL